MPSNLYAKCRGCKAPRSDVKPLSRNGYCFECACERSIAVVRAAHPGGVVPTGGMQTDSDGEQLTIQQTG